jgi:hypothetical protein
MIHQLKIVMVANHEGLVRITLIIDNNISIIVRKSWQRVWKSKCLKYSRRQEYKPCHTSSSFFWCNDKLYNHGDVNTPVHYDSQTSFIKNSSFLRFLSFSWSMSWTHSGIQLKMNRFTIEQERENMKEMKKDSQLPSAMYP